MLDQSQDADPIDRALRPLCATNGVFYRDRESLSLLIDRLAVVFEVILDAVDDEAGPWTGWEHAPLLADRMAACSEEGIPSIVQRVCRLVRRDSDPMATISIEDIRARGTEDIVNRLKGCF